MQDTRRATDVKKSTRRTRLNNQEDCRHRYAKRETIFFDKYSGDRGMYGGRKLIGAIKGVFTTTMLRNPRVVPLFTIGEERRYPAKAQMKVSPSSVTHPLPATKMGASSLFF